MSNRFDFAEYRRGRFTPGAPACIERRGSRYMRLFRQMYHRGAIDRAGLESLYIAVYHGARGGDLRRDVGFFRRAVPARG